MSTSRRVTLSDVAIEAGVSVQTASHVLSGNKTVRVAQATRERVKTAAKQVGYKPNRIAQAMRTGETRLIGVWVPVARPVITYLQSLDLLNKLAHRDGYELFITCVDPVVAYSGEGATPATWPMDGLIALDAGQAVKLFRDDPQNDDIPLVVMARDHYENGDAVDWRVRDGGRQATTHLVERGAKRVVHLTFDWVVEKYPEELRRAGYLEVLKEQGLEPEVWAIHGESSGEIACEVDRMLGEKGVPDAFFGFNDPLALGAMRALRKKGVDIPGECKVVGFGDYPQAEDSWVALTSVRLPIEKVVEQSWDYLMSRIEESGVSRLAEFDMELVVRESS